MIYRREIDGLRALAVLPVVFFHAGINAFSGGYVGVDVFFVISGYLITTIIVNQIDVNSFSLVGFYERRARRIMPALFAVMIACIPLSYFFMTPSELQSFGLSLAAVSIFSSNILFWKQADYFEASAEELPLLHTWSLAVEEQYYLLFPLFLIFFWRMGRKWIVSLMLVGLVISLLLSVWASIHAPVPNFYLAPTRIWEILAGSICAFILLDGSTVSRFRNAYSSLGFVLIAVSVFVFDDLTPFPSAYTLAPVLGTCLIILYSGQTYVGRLLGTKFFVSIGLISYSLYLWHQPVLAYLRLVEIPIQSLADMTLFFVVLFSLAYASWRFVERPFRDRQVFSSTLIFSLTGVGILAFCLTGFYLYKLDGMPERFDVEVLNSIAPEGNEHACKGRAFEEIDGMKSCEFGDVSGEKTIVLLGDSHADAFSAGLDPLFKQYGIKGLRMYSDSCHPIPGIYDSRYIHREVCERINRQLADYLSNDISAVIIELRWTFRLYPVEGEIAELTFDNLEGGVERENPPRENFVFDGEGRNLSKSGKKQAIVDYVEQLNALGIPILVVGPVPEPGWHVPKMNMRLYLRNLKKETVSTSYDLYSKRNRLVLEILTDLDELENVSMVFPHKVLCSESTGRCLVQEQGEPLYFDDDHLSLKGATQVVDQIVDPFINLKGLR
jgi:peptidoglycan/LPS O-acetylase OafA/YrhL